jgi:DNA-binding transcriptional LysR family regulator
MEFWQLRYFVALAEELHFARAAERVGIGQSPLSRSIKELESQLGLKLFRRTSRSTELTWAGETLLEDARRVLAAVEHTERTAQGVKRSAKHRLRIGVCESAASVVLSRGLSRWRQGERETELSLSSCPGRSQAADVSAGYLDAGFTAMHIDEAGIRAEGLWSENWCAVLPANHPLASEDQAGLPKLVRERVLILHSDSALAAAVKLVDRLRSMNPHLFVADHVTNPALLRLLVGAGCGVGIATESQAQLITGEDLVVRPIDADLPAVQIHLVRRSEEPSALLSRFITCLKSAR